MGRPLSFPTTTTSFRRLGEQQARLLGEYWVRRGVRFDEVYTGPRVRQIETAALAGEAFAKAGLPWPEPQCSARTGRAPGRSADQAGHAADRAGLSATSSDLHAAYLAAEAPRDKHRTFQLMFERVVMLWVSRQGRGPGRRIVARRFKQRVGAGLRRITAKRAARAQRGGIHLGRRDHRRLATVARLRRPRGVRHGLAGAKRLGHRFRLQPRPADARKLQRLAAPGRSGAGRRFAETEHLPANQLSSSQTTTLRSDR